MDYAPRLVRLKVGCATLTLVAHIYSSCHIYNTSKYTKLVDSVGFEPTPNRLRVEYAALTPRVHWNYLPLNSIFFLSGLLSTIKVKSNNSILWLLKTCRISRISESIGVSRCTKGDSLLSVFIVKIYPSQTVATLLSFACARGNHSSELPPGHRRARLRSDPTWNCITCGVPSLE